MTGENIEMPRSAFVTVLAWIFIVLGGLASAIALLQNIMLMLMFPVEEMRAALREADRMREMPAPLRIAFEYFHLWFAAVLAVSALTFVSAIGLLKRRNWARLAFIGLMVVGILWNLFGIALPFLVRGSFPPMAANTPEDIRQQFDLMWKVMVVITSLVALALTGLFAWIIKRLRADDVRREFGGG